MNTYPSCSYLYTHIHTLTNYHIYNCIMFIPIYQSLTFSIFIPSLYLHLYLHLTHTPYHYMLTLLPIHIPFIYLYTLPLYIISIYTYTIHTITLLIIIHYTSCLLYLIILYDYYLLYLY